MPSQRLHKQLSIIFKNGVERVITSPTGFAVASKDGAITEPHGLGSTLPYLDPATVAAVLSQDPSDSQRICPHPACTEVIAQEEYACRAHYYELAPYTREGVRVARHAYRQRPDETRQRQLVAAEGQAMAEWIRGMQSDREEP